MLVYDPPNLILWSALILSPLKLAKFKPYTNDDFEFKAGKRETKIYYLKIEWPNDLKDLSYAFEIDYLSIDFRVIQKD